jgi:hypothetical protein
MAIGGEQLLSIGSSGDVELEGRRIADQLLHFTLAKAGTQRGFALPPIESEVAVRSGSVTVAARCMND